jgi:hypothetical protein
MTEEFLQYIWKHQLYEQKTYHADTGEEIQIIFPGEHNVDSGPDFSNTKIRINGTLWAGNCEVHLSASDWQKHRHIENKAYENVILHVSLKNDYIIKTINGRRIPSIEICFDDQIEDNYNKLYHNNLLIPCSDKIGLIDRLYISSWLTKLMIERLEKKTYEIETLLEKTKSNWEEAFYYSITRSFGFKVNSQPFEMLARSLPLSILGHHKSNLFQIEALLFGQSGMLNNTIDDEYSIKLKTEFKYLQKKYNLKPIEKHLWKFLRLRPANFPTIRLAQFANLIFKSSSLLSIILETEDIDQLETLLDISASSYWDNHFQFSKPSKFIVKKLSKESRDLIILNTIVPFLFIYGIKRCIQKYQDRALIFLEALKPEKNSIIAKWTEYGIEARNAFESQALLQLRNEYCNKKRCTECTIGNRVIANKL